MTTQPAPAADVLAVAARKAGFDATDATLIRDGSNTLYHLPDGPVARIGPQGSHATAEREVMVARWLAGAGIPVVSALRDVPQPTAVNDRPVTWWEWLPKHRHGTTAELGALLRSLHKLTPPSSPTLPIYDPLAGLSERVAAATHMPDSDRDWLSQRLDHLRTQLDGLNASDSSRMIHGDAWQGNVAVPDCGEPLLLDLEHVSLGNPDWDLISIAVDYTDFARLSSGDYQAFVEAYGGRDVTTSADFRVLADIQELRWVCFVLNKAANSDVAAHEASHRIACLRGDVPHPWTWTAY